MYYEDDFEKEFNREEELHEYLNEVDGRARWLRVPCTRLRVLLAEGNAGICTPVEHADMDALMEDTRANTGLLLKLPEGVFHLGRTAIRTLKDRARISGNALSDVEKQTLADILNKCLKVGKGKALVRICEGKVRAVLSGDPKDYVILSMPEMFMVASAYINSDFDSADFRMGYVNHGRINAVWELEDARMEEAYQNLLKEYGKEVTGNLKAVVRITTSDVGSSGANIFYTLIENGHFVILGEALKVRHKNGKGMEYFTTNIESIFNYYKEVIRGVARLCNIHISYPVNTMAGIMEKAGFGKKMTAETVESFKASGGDQPCSAYEVYCGICEAIAIAHQSGESGQGLIRLEEKIAGCLNRRWHDFDIPGEIKY